MKVLFVGEGRHDIGDPNPNAFSPRLARGTIPTLAKRVIPEISSDSVAIAWTELRRFNPAAKKRGYPAKVAAAVLVAQRRFGCPATILVTDRDGDMCRSAQLKDGTERAQQLFPQHRIVWGVAIESVEAWTLGVPDCIAAELDVEVDAVRRCYPAGVAVEALFERSGKEDHRPKRLLERVANLKHRSDSTEFRQAVAERTDTSALEMACPEGFVPFAHQLRELLIKGTDSKRESS
ncbi:MAG: hypothetical protein L0Y72_28745 [Gemmataceae bacterium]|nr:hypothetical protein [Gemmataceae bacterium]MCI0743037.1 hypothetical protein [Gemmataceae bacterium]